MNKFEYALPKKLQDVFAFNKTPNSLLKAGGIDLLDLMKEGITTPQRLINISELEELKFLKTDSDGNLHIGPTMTLAELAENETVQTKYRALAQAAESAATPQIRHAATLGGNLCQRPRCWYYRNLDFDCARKGGAECFAIEGENQYHAIFMNQDGCVIVHPSAAAVALMALNARLKIASETTEREISIEDFFVTPEQDITRENVLEENEIITDIILPPVKNDFTSYYFKQKEKQAFDWPIAETAVAMTTRGTKCTSARIVLGAAAPVPWRVRAGENVLKNQVITVDLAKKAAREVLQAAIPLSGNAYKISVFKAVIYRTICWAGGVDPFA